MAEGIFAIRIKELRIEKNLSQAELALHVGLTQRKISKLETLQLMPTPHIIVEVARFFRVSTDYLLGLSND